MDRPRNYLPILRAVLRDGPHLAPSKKAGYSSSPSMHSTESLRTASVSTRAVTVVGILLATIAPVALAGSKERGRADRLLGWFPRRPGGPHRLRGRAAHGSTAPGRQLHGPGTGNRRAARGKGTRNHPRTRRLRPRVGLCSGAGRSSLTSTTWRRSSSARTAAPWRPTKSCACSGLLGPPW